MTSEWELTAWTVGEEVPMKDFMRWPPSSDRGVFGGPEENLQHNQATQIFGTYKTSSGLERRFYHYDGAH